MQLPPVGTSVIKKHLERNGHPSKVVRSCRGLKHKMLLYNIL